MNGISVLITSYNRFELCQRAVESALNQDFDKGSTEVVVIEDGSTEPYDGEWFTNRGCSYYYIDKVGISKARDSGVERCRYNWEVQDDDFKRVTKKWCTLYTVNELIT